MGWRQGRDCEPGELKHKASWEICAKKTQKRIRCSLCLWTLAKVPTLTGPVSLAVTLSS